MSRIEDYGYFDGTYKKVSDELKYAFQGYSYQEDDLKNNKLFNKKINELIKDNKIGYSKK